ncbi:MAG TPA: biosynthetic-type acetolactate synthase large subunit [Ruminococcaceae bacterium]|nr:biosynthetic-type acetolactate synthase large subunit [Oscillospiraceae bacterium]
MPSGAQILVKALELEKTHLLFGYPGAVICSFLDEVASSDFLTYRLVRHEQNAGHAASGYARASGKPGICFATSGPGATNLLTSLATAYMDSIPLIAITGQVESRLIGSDVFQEADITGAAEPFCKHSYQVRDAADLPRIVKEAFYIAQTGRQGPVLIDIPVDVFNQKVNDPIYPKKVEIRGYKPCVNGHPLQIKRVAEQIQKAKKPVICAGGGIFSSGAREELFSLTEKCKIPVVTTMMGIGVLPVGYPLLFGMLGLFGQKIANRAIQDCDLLILAGARVGDRALNAPSKIAAHTSVVHLDIDPAEIGKNVEADLPIVGDIGKILSELAKIVQPGDTAAWCAHLHDLQQKSVSTNRIPPEGFISPRNFFETLSAHLNEDALLVSDVGQAQIWAANYCGLKKGRFLTSGGMGTMGYALPAALGAACAQPNKQVVAVCGDGGFHMSMMELSTIKQYHLAVKIIVMRNDCLGMVHEIQAKRFGRRYVATEFEGGGPNYQILAEAYGIKSRKVTSSTDIPAAIQDFLETPGAYLLECPVDPDEPTL